MDFKVSVDHSSRDFLIGLPDFSPIKLIFVPEIRKRYKNEDE